MREGVRSIVLLDHHVNNRKQATKKLKSTGSGPTVFVLFAMRKLCEARSKRKRFRSLHVPIRRKDFEAGLPFVDIRR